MLRIISQNIARENLYHGTLFWLVETILQEGLRPQTGRLSQNWDQSSAEHVYLSKSPERALEWAVHAMESGDYEVDRDTARVSILSVDFSQLDPTLLEIDPNSRDDFQYKGSIPAQALSLLKTIDLGEQLYPICKNCGEEQWNCECDEFIPS